MRFILLRDLGLDYDYMQQCISRFFVGKKKKMKTAKQIKEENHVWIKETNFEN